MLVIIITLVQLCSSALAASVAIRSVNSNDIRKEPSDSIVWNGCESSTTAGVYLPEMLEKPGICQTRLPNHLTTSSPMEGEAPFVTQIKGNAVSSKSFLITVVAKEDEASVKSYAVSKKSKFEALYISAQSPKGFDVGHFVVDTWGTTGRVDMGYCCGKSRHHYNFYELLVKGGDWTADVTWDALGYRGPVVFNVTVVQDRSRFWHLDPVPAVVD